MKHILLACAALASILATTACKRDADPAPTPAPAEAAEAAADATKDVQVEAPPANVEVISESPHAPVPQDLADTFDAKAYAGTFTGKDTRLDIATAGTFTLDRDGVQSSGTWTLEKDGEHLLLDPGSKSEQDRRYRMVGNDELQPVGGDGETLKRDKA